jgi:hypothetical protein
LFARLSTNAEEIGRLLSGLMKYLSESELKEANTARHADFGLSTLDFGLLLVKGIEFLLAMLTGDVVQ